ncbi:MAG: inner membrane CreD family protein, partial [Spirochaetia bacterium]
MKKLKSSIQENRNWSTVLKMVLIGILLLIFLIPLQMIRALIEERNMTRFEAEGEIIQMWGGEQIIAGPVVVVPYLKRVKDEEGKIEEFTERAYFLPTTLEIAGSVDTEKRNRGIYEVTVYTADLQVTGTIADPDFSDWRVAEEDVFWQDAALVVELPDMRGVQERVTLRWDSHPIPFVARQGEIGLFDGEIRAPLSGIAGSADPGISDTHSFSFDLNLQGGRSLSFMPLGKETRVRLASSWTGPSFNGAFLPTERTVSEEGFDADWYVLSLNRGYGQRWLRGDVEGYA